jgi:hypothetical protein
VSLVIDLLAYAATEQYCRKAQSCHGFVLMAITKIISHKINNQKLSQIGSTCRWIAITKERIMKWFWFTPIS